MFIDWFAWLLFFAAPLSLLVAVSWVDRPSAKHTYRSTGNVIPFDRDSREQRRCGAESWGVVDGRII